MFVASRSAIFPSTTDTATPGPLYSETIYLYGGNMDTVWIKLTTVVIITSPTLAVDDEHESYFMFGPTGIVRFEQQYGSPHLTQLFAANGKVIAEVYETPDSIMDTLRKIRRTGGLLGNNKDKKKATKRSKTKTSKR
jgi:hypothetical protein